MLSAGDEFSPAPELIKADKGLAGCQIRSAETDRRRRLEPGSAWSLGRVDLQQLSLHVR